jgi:serine/threonine protein kinase/Tol biopolymer transport system component
LACAIEEMNIGTQLGFLEITALLGKGGMGEVYRARDAKLKRDVAIKILPDEFSRDPSRVSRFQREAEVLASLNHPNIAAIYDLQEAGGTRFLVLELVEGETLAERIQRGPIRVEEALEIGKHICEALEAAHEKGVVHRDLKPANVKITADGRVKVLDFGLAKAMETAPASTTLSNSPTLTLGATQNGVILGTAAYMSPEQAKGLEVDPRSDMFSFGSVLFEMLTGRLAFQGDTVADILASVLAREPDLHSLPPNLNPRIKELLQRCFQKNPKRRWQAAGDLRAEVETVAAVPRAASVEAGRVLPIWKRALSWGISALAVLAFSVVAYRHFEEQTRVLRLSVLFPEKASFNPGSLPAVSPDGMHIAYAVVTEGQQRLWVRDLDSPNARLLSGTEGTVNPFWSPDSRWIGFFADGRLKKIEATGGPIATLCPAVQGRGGTWNKDDVILFGASQVTGLYRVSAGGGTPVPVTPIDKAAGERYHRTPSFLPDGHHFLYTALNQDLEKNAIYIADLNSADESRGRRLLMVASSNAVYVAPGYLLFARDGTLMAQPFDAGKGQITGEAVHVAEQIDMYAGSSQAEFSVSQTGILVYTSGGAGSTLQLTWLDRNGRPVGSVGPPGDVNWPRISPDGDTVAYERRPHQALPDIWMYDLVRGTDSPFTFDKGAGYPTWSSGGNDIAFLSTKNADPGVVKRSSTGPANVEILEKGSKRPADWSRDGRYIVEATFASFPKTGFDVWVLPLFGDKKSYPYASTEFAETYPRLSPDRRWLAYVSDQSKREEVYVDTFPMPTTTRQVSVNGGSFPAWSHDGKELYFIAGDGKMMAVDIKSGPQFDHGVPKPLFPTVGLGTGDYGAYDVGKDGRFLMPLSANPSPIVSMTVVVNWLAGLKR